MDAILASEEFWCHNCRLPVQATAEYGCSKCFSGCIEPSRTPAGKSADGYVVPAYVPRLATHDDFAPSTFDDSKTDSDEESEDEDEDDDDDRVEQAFSRTAPRIRLRRADGRVESLVQLDFSELDLRIGLARTLIALAGIRTSQQQISGLNPMGETTVLGDYVIGDMDGVIAALMSMDGGRGGAPPASDSTIDELRQVAVTDIAEDTECAICQDMFCAGEAAAGEGEEMAVRLGCDHVFHKACLEPWLRLHGICPTCRAQVSTPK